MDVCRHHDPGVEAVALIVKKAKRIRNKASQTRISESACWRIENRLKRFEVLSLNRAEFNRALVCFSFYNANVFRPLLQQFE